MPISQYQRAQAAIESIATPIACVTVAGRYNLIGAPKICVLTLNVGTLFGKHQKNDWATRAKLGRKGWLTPKANAQLRLQGC